MALKLCTGPCGRELPEGEFHWRSKAKGIRIARCRECASLWSKSHYRKNPRMYLEKAAKRNNRVVAENFASLYEYLSEHPCVDCGERDPVVLHFDHVRGKKSYNISVAVNAAKMRWSTILKEIEKCEIRCANCHMRRTAKQAGWRKYFAGLAIVGEHLHGKQV